MLEGIQSGNHHLRISHDGFDDWLGDVICDGKPQRVLAELRSLGAQSSSAIPMPGTISNPQVQARQTGPTRGFANTGDHAAEPDKTILQNWQTGGSQGGIFVDSQPPPKRSFFSPLLIGGIGVVILFFLGAAGLAGVYLFGIFPRTTSKPPTNVANNSTSPTPGPSGSPAETIKPDLVAIPGGTFMMGRNSGPDQEKPEHCHRRSVHDGPDRGDQRRVLRLSLIDRL